MQPEWLKDLYYAALAGLGGGLGYIYRETRAARTILITRLLLTACVAAFIGYHMVMVYEAMGFDPKIVGALNGLSALLGVEFVLFLFKRWITAKLGVTVDERLSKALADAGWTPPASGGTVAAQQDTEAGDSKASGKG